MILHFHGIPSHFEEKKRIRNFSRYADQLLALCSLQAVRRKDGGSRSRRERAGAVEIAYLRLTWAGRLFRKLPSSSSGCFGDSSTLLTGWDQRPVATSG